MNKIKTFVVTHKQKLLLVGAVILGATLGVTAASVAQSMMDPTYEEVPALPETTEEQIVVEEIPVIE